ITADKSPPPFSNKSPSGWPITSISGRRTNPRGVLKTPSRRSAKISRKNKNSNNERANMNNLPQISHRAFGPAITHGNKGGARKLRRESARNGSRLTLEVLKSTEPLVDLAARPLRAAAAPARA